MTHTDKSSVVATAVFNVINTAKVTIGLDDVLYGDHNNVPKAKTAVVMPGRKRRELDGVSAPGGRSRNYMDVIIFVYSSKMQDEASGRMETDLLAEGIEDALHADTTLGNIIIHGFVTEMDPGFVFRDRSQFRAVQMTYVAQSKTYITPTP